MKLGFVSAILPDLSLEEVFKTASEIGYNCVELMCWPPGKADRRYAGVTHIDITSLDANKIKEIHDLSALYNVSISALGYYPNPLINNIEIRKAYIAHLKHLIRAAARLKIPIVNTFVGRDQSKSITENWPLFIEIWQGIIAQASGFDIKIGIENCPMLFTEDEWPGGQNLFTTPAIWRKGWKQFPTLNFGLNYDPSHMIIQHMDTNYPILQFPERLHHVHAKDVTIDHDQLKEHGIFDHPNLWHTPKIPGRGDVNWSSFFQSLKQINYQGAVCVEVEDRSFEGSLDNRIQALRESYEYLSPFFR